VEPHSRPDLIAITGDTLAEIITERSATIDTMSYRHVLGATLSVEELREYARAYGNQS
jgi:hypothetical protein